MLPLIKCRLTYKKRSAHSSRKQQRNETVATFQNEVFREQRVVVDGHRYESCAFIYCTLVYTGGELPAFVHCRFRKTRIRLEDRAHNTTQYLSLLVKTGLSGAADRVLSGMQQNKLPLSMKPAAPPAINTGRNYRELFTYMAVMVGVAALLVLALWYGFLVRPEQVLARPGTPLTATSQLRAMPDLPEDLDQYYDDWYGQQKEQLGGYGWIDQSAGIARIPIDTAMELLVAEGLPIQQQTQE